MTHLPPVSVISIGVSFATIHTLPVHCSTLQRRTNLGTGRRTKNRLFEVYKKPLPRHQSSSCRITGKLLRLSQTLAILRPELSWNRKTPTADLTRSLTTPNLYNQRREITRSMIKNYSPLSMLLNTSCRERSSWQRPRPTCLQLLDGKARDIRPYHDQGEW